MRGPPLRSSACRHSHGSLPRAPRAGPTPRERCSPRPSPSPDGVSYQLPVRITTTRREALAAISKRHRRPRASASWPKPSPGWGAVRVCAAKRRSGKETPPGTQNRRGYRAVSYTIPWPRAELRSAELDHSTAAPVAPALRERRSLSSPWRSRGPSSRRRPGRRRPEAGVSGRSPASGPRRSPSGSRSSRRLPSTRAA